MAQSAFTPMGELGITIAGEPFPHLLYHVEQAHHRFNQAVDQALHVRGSEAFPSRAAYQRFLQDLVRWRNLTRQLARAFRWIRP